tara:strand:+ start:3353 stop:3793 length:441 start_codon:yes stop_codon:yes gene_type:complete
MANGYSFNGTTLTFDTGDATVPAYPITITSWATSGGDRPEIDITTAGDTYRKILPGLETPNQYTFECVYQSPPGVTDAAWKAALDVWNDDCTKGVLTLTFPTSCSTTDNETFSGNAWCTNIDFEGSIDGAITMSITFLMEATANAE